MNGAVAPFRGSGPRVSKGVLQPASYDDALPNGRATAPEIQEIFLVIIQT